ncbi:MAG: YibE/F family protein [Desulfitobacteriaceae bacterium]
MSGTKRLAQFPCATDRDGRAFRTEMVCEVDDWQNGGCNVRERIHRKDVKMFEKLINLKNLNVIFMLLILSASLILILLPTGLENDENRSSVRAQGLIMATDNSQMFQRGIVKTGIQGLTVRILNGPFKGQEVSGNNQLLGKLELDKVFQVGDKALIVIDHDGGKILYVNVMDHYRLNIELVLFATFILLLILFAGWTGVKAVLSFVFTVLMIWKVLLPGFLKGWDPIFLSLGVVTILTAVTCFLVADLTRKGLVAFLGAFSGILLTCILALFFGSSFQVHGAVVPFAETLLYSGYPHLDITRIFLSGIFLASAGALMDVSMDISASIAEVVAKRPDISVKEAIMSGFSVAKAVTGTMTTTLLLAYSGGYTALLMVFMAQGTPLMNVFNITYVAAEILHILVGSFGLVMVAPFTALLGGYLFTRPSYVQKLTEEKRDGLELETAH